MSSSRTNPMRPFNLFLTLFPDFFVRTQLSHLAVWKRAKHGLKGKLIAENRYHVTLYGWSLSHRPPDGLVRAIRTIAAEVAVLVPPFEVRLDRVSTFLRSNAFVLHSREGNEILRQFREELGIALGSLGMLRRSSFNPHITLLYDQRIVHEEAVEPVNWISNKFALILSHAGKTKYDYLGEWDLRG
jgi:2'-5' RNA ligase